MENSKNASGVKKTRNIDATHLRILKASLNLFSRKGFKGTTTREISIASEVTEATLYRHFASKEDIFREIAK